MHRSTRWVFVLAGLVAVSGCEQMREPVGPEMVAGIEASRARAAAPSIVDIALSTGQHDVLVAAVVALGLDGALSGNEHYTVFAPTDAAFAELCGTTEPGACVGALVDALGVETVRDVVLFHVTRGDRNATSVLASGRLRMLNGGWATARVENGTAYIAGAPIAATDIRARNGIVHVLDGVMLP